MKSLLILFAVLAILGLSEAWYINHAINNLVRQNMAQNCPVYLTPPQERCRGN